jgi:hypothetical protein
MESKQISEIIADVRETAKHIRCMIGRVYDKEPVFNPETKKFDDE